MEENIKDPILNYSNKQILTKQSFSCLGINRNFDKIVIGGLISNIINCNNKYFDCSGIKENRKVIYVDFNNKPGNTKILETAIFLINDINLDNNLIIHTDSSFDCFKSMIRLEKLILETNPDLVILDGLQNFKNEIDYLTFLSYIILASKAYNCHILNTFDLDQIGRASCRERVCQYV